MNKEEIIIDLREKPRSCMEHPLVRLTNILKKLKKGEIVKVVTDNKTVPVETIKVLAKRNSLKCNIIEEKELYVVYLKK